MRPWMPRGSRDASGRSDRSDRRDRGRSTNDIALPGVIDTLGEAFALLVTRPWAILPVVVVDLLVSFGPRVTLAPLANAFGPAGNYDGFARRVVTEWQSIDDVNATAFVALGAPLARMPALSNGVVGGDIDRGFLAGTVSSLPLAVLCLVVLGLVALSYLSVAWHRVLLREAIAQHPIGIGALTPRGVGVQVRRLVGLAFTLAGLLLLVSLPVTLVTVAGAIIGFGTSGLVVLVASLPVVVGLLFFTFCVPAMVMDDLGVLASMRSSFRVVRTFFWATVRFMFVTLIIAIGLLVVFHALATTLPGLLLAVAGNAFIASGMLAATMLFYRDRVRHLGVMQSS